jgi:hypothetical protein
MNLIIQQLLIQERGIKMILRDKRCGIEGKDRNNRERQNTSRGTARVAMAACKEVKPKIYTIPPNQPRQTDEVPISQTATHD